MGRERGRGVPSFIHSCNQRLTTPRLGPSAILLVTTHTSRSYYISPSPIQNHALAGTWQQPLQSVCNSTASHNVPSCETDGWGVRAVAGCERRQGPGLDPCVYGGEEAWWLSRCSESILCGQAVLAATLRDLGPRARPPPTYLLRMPAVSAPRPARRTAPSRSLRDILNDSDMSLIKIKGLEGL